MNEPFRTETDSMGAMQVPSSAYYGAQTARAVENFPISELRFSRRFIRALGLIKKNAALTNQELDGLKPDLAAAIVSAVRRVQNHHKPRLRRSNRDNWSDRNTRCAASRLRLRRRDGPQHQASCQYATPKTRENGFEIGDQSAAALTGTLD